jgi:kynurenine formamidase
MHRKNDTFYCGDSIAMYAHTGTHMDMAAPEF